MTISIDFSKNIFVSVPLLFVLLEEKKDHNLYLYLYQIIVTKFM